jgi:hypothetical protein
VDVEPAQRPFAVPLRASEGAVEIEVASQVVGDHDLRLEVGQILGGLRRVDQVEVATRVFGCP